MRIWRAIGGSPEPNPPTCKSRLLFSGTLLFVLFNLYRWTESVTCTGSSLFAVGYAYSERHRKYSALLPFRLRQTDLNPRQECQ